VTRRLMVGTYALSAGYYDAYYLKAQKIRRLIKNDFDNAFAEVDVIMGPTSPHTAFKIGSQTNDPVTMYLEDIYTIAVNLAGLPGISVPAGLVNNLPVGLQIIGNSFSESHLLNIAHQFQQATDWHTQTPEI
jgi:aspartyl-tRNA(Asn)/glutamyl-tRNA(Gln) amidotransferase subunit A